MYLEEEERRARSYDWSGARVRRQRLVWLVIAACSVCALACAAVASGIIQLPVNR